MTTIQCILSIPGEIKKIFEILSKNKKCIKRYMRRSKGKNTKLSRMQIVIEYFWCHWMWNIRIMYLMTAAWSLDVLNSLYGFCESELLFLQIISNDIGLGYLPNNQSENEYIWSFNRIEVRIASRHLRIKHKIKSDSTLTSFYTCMLDLFVKYEFATNFYF